MVFLFLILSTLAISSCRADQATFRTTVDRKRNGNETIPFPAADFASFLSSVSQEWSVPGLATVVVNVNDDDPDLTFPVGIASYPDKPVDENTVFGIASNSKAFAAAAIATLIDQGKLDWRTPVSSILPDLWELKDPIASKYATVEDILSHQTGLPRHDAATNPQSSLDDVVRQLSHLDPSTEFRQDFQYNNYMYMTAAKIVSRVSGMNYRDYVKQTIFDPLNMTSTTYQPLVDNPGNLSTGHLTAWNGTTYGMEYWCSDCNLDALAGAGGITTTVKDVGKWLNLLIKSYRKATDWPETELPVRILNDTSILEMTRPRSIFDPSSTEYTSPSLYSTGFWQQYWRGKLVIMHDGDVPGFQSMVAWLPTEGYGVATFTNTAPVGDFVAKIATMQAIDLLLGLPPVDLNTQLRASYESYLSTLAPAKPLDAPKPLGVSVQALYGDYYDPGYGKIVVCPVSKDVDSSFTDSACDKLYERTQSALSVSQYTPWSSVDNTTTSVLIDFPRAFLQSHLVAVHHDGNTFNATTAIVAKDVNGQYRVYYDQIGSIQLKFVQKDNKVDQIQAHGIWGKDSRVKEDADHVEVVFGRV